MPFPKRHIKLITGYGTSPRSKYITDEETGIIQEVVQACNKTLPKPELFKIKNQIKAGITLNEVPTKVVSNVTGSAVEAEVTAITEKVKRKIKLKKKSTEVTHEDT